MKYIQNYISPFGEILITSNEIGITNILFKKSKYYHPNFDNNYTKKETKLILQAKKWLDIYFQGKNPDFMPNLDPSGTDFRKNVWEILKTIPYGKTLSYGEVAKIISIQKGIKKMSSQAVGNAISNNKIAILIPCHRIVSSNNIGGYNSGIDIKLKLLTLEKII